MPNLNRLRYEPFALVSNPTWASILKNATVVSLSGGGGGGGGTDASNASIQGCFVRNSWPHSQYYASHQTVCIPITVPITGVIAQPGNTIHALPFRLLTPARPQGLYIVSSAAAAPSILYFSIFDNTSTVTCPTYPKNKLIEMKSIDCNAVAGGYHSVSTYSVAQLLPAGLYWAVCHYDGNSPTLGYHHPNYWDRVIGGLSNATIGIQFACGAGYSVPSAFPTTGPVYVSAADVNPLGFSLFLGA